VWELEGPGLGEMSCFARSRDDPEQRLCGVLSAAGSRVGVVGSGYVVEAPGSAAGKRARRRWKEIEVCELSCESFFGHGAGASSDLAPARGESVVFVSGGPGQAKAERYGERLGSAAWPNGGGGKGSGGFFGTGVEVKNGFVSSLPGGGGVAGCLRVN
jgi:hypothetical protein